MKLFFIILILFPFYCPAQSQVPLRFEHIDETNGLSNNVVKTIFSDSRGSMWFGTEDGLNVYDGASFDILRHSNIDSNSIASNIIYSINEDDKRNIWVAEQCAGLSKMNPFNMKSENFYADGKKESISTGCDIEVVFDNANDLWLCDRNSIAHLNKDGKTFEHFFPFEATEKNRIYQIAKDNNLIWFTHMNGLKRFDIKSKKINSYDKLVDNNTCGKISVTKEGCLLVTTWKKGLYIINAQKNKSMRLLDGLITTSAALINLNGEQQLWVGTSNGLYVANIDNGLLSLTDKAFTRYVHNTEDASSLSDDEINCIYIDTTKNSFIWVGTNKGINKLNPSYLQFHKQQITKNNVPFITTSLYSLLKDESNNSTNYWLCYWHGSGLLQTDSLFAIKKQIILKDINGNATIVSNAVKDKNGLLWLATWNGLCCYDEKQNKIIKTYNKESQGKIKLNTNSLDYILLDSKERFWIGTYGQGINLVNFKDSTVKIFTADGKPNSLVDNRSDFIFEDNKHDIWIAGSGLQRYREETNDFKIYLPQRGNKNSLPGSVNYLFNDTNGKLWIATSGGICLYDETKDQFHVFTSKDGLPGDDCQAITEDNNNNLWITTSGGLCSININSFNITSFTTNDGLPTNQLGTVIEKDNNGKIFFSLGSSNSPFIYFDPSVLGKTNEKIPFHFTGINILGKEQLSDKPIDDIASLNLNYKENVFTVFFKSFDYRNTANIRYQCMLEGFDKTFIDIGHRNNVTYTNLDGGTYTLKVKATDASGKWLNKTLQLTIVVQPPFWKTWWFYLLVILIVAFSVYIIFKMRVKNIRREEEQKTATANEIAELRMKALKAQMNPHFIFNSLSSIQESILDGKPDAAAKYLGKFSKLIRIVLEFSDEKLITLLQEKEYLQLYLELESFRFDEFSFFINIDNNIHADFIKIPPMLIQPFIENSIKHGLSHKKGNKYVKINFEETADQFIKVSVIDNGVGRDASAAINESRTLSHRSLGMNITSNRLQLMHQKNESSITVIDNKDSNGNTSGTEVIILIPIQTTS